MHPARMLDLTGVTILGWTPTDDQLTAGAAVLLGAFLAIALLTVARRASSMLIMFLVTSAVGVGLWSAVRFGLLAGIVSQFTR